MHKPFKVNVRGIFLSYNCFAPGCVNNFKTSLFSFHFIGDNCIWKLRDTFFNICFDLEQSTSCVATLFFVFLLLLFSENHLLIMNVYITDNDASQVDGH